jgi:glycosyltransferase involved in cell wall biosynthesis
MSPRVSVVMSVHNGEKYLRDAIESILGQTFSDFEFIIIDDGSSDGSAEIVAAYSDQRIRFIRNEQNIGLTRSLNKGLDLADGAYIARMDSDDISLPERLAKQVAFMDTNLQVGACGTWALDIDEAGHIIGKRETLVGAQLDNFYWRTSLIHSSSVFRFSHSHGPWYDPALFVSQDYDLWLRVGAEQKLSNLREHLLLYRVHHQSITSVSPDKQMNSAYHSFGKHVGEGIFSFEEFKALMGYSHKLDPLRRSLAMMRLAKRIHKPYRRFLGDDLKYARTWLRTHES